MSLFQVRVYRDLGLRLNMPFMKRLTEFSFQTGIPLSFERNVDKVDLAEFTAL